MDRKDRDVETSDLDLDAPILPGEGAAGLHVGARVTNLPLEVLARFIVTRRVNPCLPNAVVTLYRSAAVTLYVENRVIDTIALYGGYRGRLRDGIGLGSAVAEVEARIGPLAEDSDGRLMIQGVPGVSFMVAERLGKDLAVGASSLRSLSIAQIFVYRI